MTQYQLLFTHSHMEAKSNKMSLRLFRMSSLSTPLQTLEKMKEINSTVPLTISLRGLSLRALFLSLLFFSAIASEVFAGIVWSHVASLYPWHLKGGGAAVVKHAAHMTKLNKQTENYTRNEVRAV